VRELVVLTAGEFLVSLLMGLAALCAFCWAAASGLLSDVEHQRGQVLEREGIEHDRQG
jgi:cbb3-type cytochrome oxidase maturation protein